MFYANLVSSPFSGHAVSVGTFCEAEQTQNELASTTHVICHCKYPLKLEHQTQAVRGKYQYNTMRQIRPYLHLPEGLTEMFLRICLSKLTMNFQPV